MVSALHRIVFADRLRKARLWRNYSQAELALKAGIPASAVSHFERGRRAPSLENLTRLALSLNVSADYLLSLSASYTGSSDFLDGLEPPVRDVLMKARDLMDRD